MSSLCSLYITVNALQICKSFFFFFDQTIHFLNSRILHYVAPSYGGPNRAIWSIAFWIKVIVDNRTWSENHQAVFTYTRSVNLANFHRYIQHCNHSFNIVSTHSHQNSQCRSIISDAMYYSMC